jgi:hypothetical protein
MSGREEERGRRLAFWEVKRERVARRRKKGFDCDRCRRKERSRKGEHADGGEQKGSLHNVAWEERISGQLTFLSTFTQAGSEKRTKISLGT